MFIKSVFEPVNCCYIQQIHAGNGFGKLTYPVAAGEVLSHV